MAMDLYVRKIVGWSMALHMRTYLACSAINMAIIAGQPLAGLVMHNNYDSLYINNFYLDLLTKH